MQGQLFTHYFLTDGIRTTPEWKASVDDAQEFTSFREGVSGLFDSFSSYSDPNEAVTEQDLIRPVLERLGWTAYMNALAAGDTETVVKVWQDGSGERDVCRPRDSGNAYLPNRSAVGSPATILALFTMTHLVRTDCARAAS